MSETSDSDSVHTDFLTCPPSDESAPIDPEVPVRSEKDEPTSPQRRGRKQPKPKKSTNDRILKEIQYLQQSTGTIIPRAAFHRLVRGILVENGVDLYDKDYRITADALLALQESTEMYLSQFFEDCGCATMHRKAATLSIQDLLFIQLLRRDR